MNVFSFVVFWNIYVVNVVVGADLCSPCDTSITSCDSNYVCNAATYRCECPTDGVQYGDNCCKCLFIYIVSDITIPSTSQSQVVVIQDSYKSSCPIVSVLLQKQVFVQLIKVICSYETWKNFLLCTNENLAS